MKCKVGILCLLCLHAMGALGQAPPEAPATIECILQPVQEGFNVIVETDRDAELVFKQEPDYAGDIVHRKAIPFGSNSDFMGVAYDVSGSMLYLDRNRNLDLTDDGPGVDLTEEALAGFGDFSGVAVECMHGETSVSYVLDIEFYGGYLFTTTVRSGWEAEAVIGGKTCRMGVADNLDGVFNGGDVFLLDHDGHQQARLPYGEVDELPLPDVIHVAGQAYRLACALQVQEGKTVAAATLTPVTESLMDLAFEGQHVSRVMLRDEQEHYTLLDWPTATMRIPEGSYVLHRVDLLDSFSATPRRKTKIKVGRDAPLKAGGPLKQEVSVTRSGNQLNLAYALVSEDKLEYTPDKGPAEAPRFNIYRGNQLLASDQFEYG